MKPFDIIIIGSGLAGLSCALSLDKHCKVAIISKGRAHEGCTQYAQGGIAAAIGKRDSVKKHIQDTLKASGKLCKTNVVKLVANDSRHAIDWLIQQGVNFATTKNKQGKNTFHFGQGGGHSCARILHTNDTTGKTIETTLLAKVRQRAHTKIFTEHTAIDLIVKNNRCVGAYILDNKTKKIKTFAAKCLVLATGGASKIYLYTSNPDTSSGDGIAMAYRAGCTTSNLEFNQFHPTCLYHPGSKLFLISETVRGEGGKLLLPNGKNFMHKFDPRKELAPRDIVARAIDCEMKRLDIPYVYLDISHKPAHFIKQRFPFLYQECLKFGFDMTKSPIPVVPAAHYTCGGVIVDKSGRTKIKNLYAIGETAYSGLHGANRMASNSLLECIVFGRAAASTIKENLKKISAPAKLPDYHKTPTNDNLNEEITIAQNRHELQQLMWNYVGIIRTNRSLQQAKRRIALLKSEIHEYYKQLPITKNLIELRNLLTVADLMVKAAIKRKENCGLHYNLDNLNA